jgi:hypothetical protein
MNAIYRRTQVGKALLGVLGIGILGASLPLLLVRGQSGTWVPAAIAVLVSSLGFPRLTTEVHREYVECRFGVFRRRLASHEILEVSVVTNPWYFGWGIRRIPGGWLWNVAGSRAVQLKLTGGRLFRIGSDDPEGLRQAVMSVLGPSGE